eukprot:4371248-Amphidinium_carterae.1
MKSLQLKRILQWAGLTLKVLIQCSTVRCKDAKRYMTAIAALSHGMGKWKVSKRKKFTLSFDLGRFYVQSRRRQFEFAIPSLRLPEK